MSFVEKLRKYKQRVVFFVTPLLFILPRIGHAAARFVPQVAAKGKMIYVIIIGTVTAATGATSWVYYETDNPTRDMIAVVENMQLFNVSNFNEQVSKPHYPGNRKYAELCSKRKCPTGPTLAFGYDAGFRNPDDMAKDLKKAGIDEERVQYFIISAGKKGLEAYDWIKEQEKLGLIKKVSKQEGLILLEIAIERAINNVNRRLKREKLTGKLNEMQFAILVSLDYNCPCLVSNSSVKNLWKLIRIAVNSQKNEDWHAVADEIRYRSGSNKNPQLQKRRHMEAQNFLNYSVTTQEDDLPPAV